MYKYGKIVTNYSLLYLIYICIYNIYTMYIYLSIYIYIRSAMKGGLDR